MTTLTTLLFVTRAAGQHHLEGLFGPGGLNLGQVHVAGYAVQPPQVSGALLDLMDEPLSNLAGQAWDATTRVQQARQRTAAAPGAREVVVFGEHTISSTQNPSVEASMGGGSVTLLRLTVEVEIQASTVRLVIQGGRVVDTLPGQAQARARVSVGDSTLVERELTPVDLGERGEMTGADPVQTAAPAR